jgi:hypothetical protein
MTVITCNTIPEIGNNVVLRDILNKNENWQIITVPKVSDLRYSPYQAVVRKENSEITKDVYFYVEV